MSLVKTTGASSVDELIASLIGMSTIRVPVSDIQRHRWEIAAQNAGLTIEQFVTMRVEAALTFGTDPGTLRLIYNEVKAIRTGVAPGTQE